MSWLPAKPRRAQIFALGLPIVAGMLSQNVLNIVDTAMVGTLGDVALAATGLGGFANFMATSFIMGLSAGVQAIAAQRLGENRTDVLAVALNAGLIFAFVWAVPWTWLLHWASPAIFGFLIGDAAVIGEGVPYLQIRLLSAFGVGINAAFRGFWNGTNRPQLYMRTLIVSHITNLFLNWVLIYGNLGAPELGVLGAGLGEHHRNIRGLFHVPVDGFSTSPKQRIPDHKANQRNFQKPFLRSPSQPESPSSHSLRGTPL